MPLTNDRQIQSLKPKTQPYDTSVTGTRGLVLRTYPSGAKSWIYRARNKATGKLEKKTLGEYRSGQRVNDEDARLSLEEARAKVSGFRAVKMRPGDVRAAEHEAELAATVVKAAKAKQDARDGYTLAELVDDYIDVISNEKNASAPRGQRYISTWKEVRRALTRYLLDRTDAGDLSKIAHKPAQDVTDDDIKLILAELPSVQANRVRAYTSALYTWGRKNKKVTHNPTDLIDKNTETARTRHLLDAELRRLLADLPSSGLDADHQRLLMFLLLSGVRLEQAVSLKMDAVDFADNLIVWGRTKNGDPQTLPMSPQMRVLLEQKKDSVWAFEVAQAKPTEKPKPMRKDSIHGPLAEAIKNKKLRVMKFTPHDLRRSMRTGLARLGCPEVVAELAIAHKIGGVRGIYNQYSYLEPIRDWLEKWGRHIESLKPGFEPACEVAA